MMQEDLSKYPPHFRALMAVRPRGGLKRRRLRLGAQARCCENITCRQKLPFYTEKLNCAHISRGHDPLLIDLREKWGLDR